MKNIIIMTLLLVNNVFGASQDLLTSRRDLYVPFHRNRTQVTLLSVRHVDSGQQCLLMFRELALRHVVLCTLTLKDCIFQLGIDLHACGARISMMRL
jgi:hypothetical protein